MDQTWMKLPRGSDEYKKALNEFLDDLFQNTAVGNQISCPCKKCKMRFWLHRNDVFDHLVIDGFVRGFEQWILEREQIFLKENMSRENVSEGQCCDNIDELLHDTFRDVAEGIGAHNGIEDVPNEEARKFYKLVEEGKQELYPGCRNFSALSFQIRLYLFKCLNGLSNVAFDDLLELLREAFPHAKLPKSFSEAKNTVRDLGLDYKKIHACPNDCMLYWKEHESANSCPKCKVSRWKSDKVPAKILRYFPLKPRLQRLFMCPQTAKAMTWHDKERPKDENIRHPADGQAWKEFDSLYPNFSHDPRNIRIGIASDGFNPFRTMSVAHSTWPVVLINYNLPPWMSMKPEYFMLSLLISGPTSPGNDIDVYLQPMIDDLKDIWINGLETYDAHRKEIFTMRVALMCTISDFPAYSMLSGWSTKGRWACPCCNHNTCSQYLKHSRKTCYMGHRRFLSSNHPWRFDENSFNGGKEETPAPCLLSGTEVVGQLQNFKNDFGKKKQKKSSDRDGPWKKKSIFFDLPYWEHLKCRHNLDVMHIEKNIFDNVVGTLLDIAGKTKDHGKARLDLIDLGIKEHLHPILSQDGHNIIIPSASFSMTNVEKDTFLKVLKEAKLPYGYASNVSKCVHVRERKLMGYKSHDAHIILHHLLQVAVRKSLPENVAIALIRLGNFFRRICSKVISHEELQDLESEIVEILCLFEKIFPPAFFDIMVHLPIHLVNEIKLGGPVQYRWMFFIERYLCKLKSYVRNRCRPEGCIAEGYLAEECLTFCSRYLHDGVKTRIDRRCNRSKSSSNSNVHEKTLFPKIGYPTGGKKRTKGKGFTIDNESLKQAHRYIIFNANCEEVEKYIEEHHNLVNHQSGRSRWVKERSHSIEFITWFQDKVKKDVVDDHIFWLAKGPNPKALKYPGYFVNGYRFCTKERDSRLKTQNSGVTLSALTSSFASSRDQNPVIGDVTYYGVIQEIIELDFWSSFSVVLFRCDWFTASTDNFGLTYVNFKKLCYKDDPFVLASQVHQVFYVQDPLEHDIHYVMNKVPRDFFDFEDLTSESYWNEPSDSPRQIVTIENISDNCSREGVAMRTMDINNILNDGRSVEESGHDSDYDDTDWDWMHAKDATLS